MRLFSTNSPNEFVDLKTAVLKGLPDDNGLYMPERISKLPNSFLENLRDYSFSDIAAVVTKHLFQGIIPDDVVERMTAAAINFPAPVVSLTDRLHVLELFHGPSLAFKDFGARFMAQLMGYFNRTEEKELIILVATSGDTGGAVAAGFHNTPGIEVVILYPKDKVSLLQEKQLTTLGGNVRALRVDGTFDDCQSLVKSAFLDRELNQSLRLSSANSINISRLIPQSFYYFEAFKQIPDHSSPISFCIPSGNFGNLTAGILAQKMGLPIKHFIAATNANDVVPAYLKTGEYQPRPSVRTLSNAMDVGAPSNFTRLNNLYGSTWNIVKEHVLGYAYNDQETEIELKRVYDSHNYLLDPHGAVGSKAAHEYLNTHPDHQVILFETAHPGKFQHDVERIVETEIILPKRLEALRNIDGQHRDVSTDFSEFRDILLNDFR